MKEIKLTQDKVALVDDSDFELQNKWRWYADYHGYGNWYAARDDYETSTKVYLHNEIMDVKGVDHINGNGLDNRRENLRIANQSQNAANRNKIARVCSSTFKGVSWAKREQRWCASIKKDYKRYHLGYFKDELEAAKAYNTAAVEMFGEFARLNNV